MFNLHFRDGRTQRLDLEGGTPELLESLGRSDFQDSLTAVTIKMAYPTKKGETCAQFSITKPEGFEGRTWFRVENVKPHGRVKGGERVVVFAGDIRLVLMVHSSQPAVRVSVARIGKRVSNPHEQVGGPKAV